MLQILGREKKLQLYQWEPWAVGDAGADRSGQGTGVGEHHVQLQCWGHPRWWNGRIKSGTKLTPDQNIRQKLNQGRKLSGLITLSINSTWLALLKPDEEMGMTRMLKSFFYYLFSKFSIGLRGGGVTLSKMSLNAGVGNSLEASEIWV